MKIAHPLFEYNDEALQLVSKFKDIITSQGIMQDKDKVEELFFENICQRRIVLTKKLLVLDAFNSLFRKYIVFNDNKKENEDYDPELYNVREIKDDEFLFIIDSTKFSLKEILWTLKFTLKLHSDEFTKENILSTKKYLDKNFDFENYCIKDPPEVDKAESEEVEIKPESEKVEKVKENKESKEEDENYIKSKNEECTCGLNFTHSNSSNNNSTSNHPPHPKNYTSENVINLSIEKQDSMKEVQKSDSDVKRELQNEVNNVSHYKEKLNCQHREVKVLQSEKAKLETQKSRAETVLALLKKFVAMKDCFNVNKDKFAFMKNFIERVVIGEEDFSDLIFIGEIVMHFQMNKEEILTKASVEEYYEPVETCSENFKDLIEEEETQEKKQEKYNNIMYERKVAVIEHTFKEMEAALYFQIQDILNEK